MPKIAVLLPLLCATFSNSFQPSANLRNVAQPPSRKTEHSKFATDLAKEFTRLATTLRAASSSSISRRRQLHKDVVIIGGGLAGLSAALYLSQIDPDRHITIFDKEDVTPGEKTAVSSFAAAGMLAPQSERLPKGDYLDLCMASKRMYPEFANLVESMAQEAGPEGEGYLIDEDPESANNLEPWNIGYVASGGFLAPAFAGDNVATWAPPEENKGTARWLDATQVRELEPNLHPDVVGGWWFPEDASVDARRLTCSLRAACVGAGIDYKGGSQYDVSSLDLEEGNCKGLWLANGRYVKTNSILVANGAWMRTLLPVPLEPHKGQSLSLRMPKDRPPLLRRVLFAQDSYIVPKADGRIVIGATVEAGSYDPNVTPAGIMHILTYALDLVPGLADLTLEETWAGLRPTTPDKGPILGETPWENLFLAGGYWRNGVLLAPKTGELIANLIAGNELDKKDRRFLKAFSWDRFTSDGGGAQMAADARYAAAMYPVHTRKSGAGISAAVGTELGSYSTAVSAQEERKRDREAMFGGGNDDAFERAASLGKLDSTAFSFDDDEDKDDEDDSSEQQKILTGSSPINELPQAKYLHGLETSEDASIVDDEPVSRSPYLDDLDNSAGNAVPYDGSPDAITVGYAEADEADKKEDLELTYAVIRKNKAEQTVEMEDSAGEEREDPGFRIYHVDSETGEHREVPPYTSPGDFLEMIEKEKQSNLPSEPADKEQEESIPHTEGQETVASKSSGAVDTTETYDGYQAIIQGAAGNSEEDIRAAMRKARMSNRQEQSDQELYPFAVEDTSEETTTSAPEQKGVDQGIEETKENLSSVYEQIISQKAASTEKLSDEEVMDEREDPGFRIWHVDSETGEHREVPPYTSPGEFLSMIEEEKKEAKPSAGQPTTQENPKQVELSDSTSSELATGPTCTTVDVPRSNGATKHTPETYDGYQSIIQGAADSSEEDMKEAMRKARLKNREGQTGIDESDLHL